MRVATPGLQQNCFPNPSRKGVGPRVAGDAGAWPFFAISRCNSNLLEKVWEKLFEQGEARHRNAAFQFRSHET